MTVAAALSTMTVQGMLVRPSSHAVSRLPWRSGRVSHAYTSLTLPCPWATRMMPSAVPMPPVASMPVLQCVSTRAPWGNRLAPASAMAWHIRASSSQMRCASSRRVFASVAPALSSPLALIRSCVTRLTRSTAQRRLTAVGRASAMVSHASDSHRRAADFPAAREPSSTARAAAAANPMVAATPMRGAPRTRRDCIASTMSSIVWMSTNRVSAGRHV